VLLHLLLWSFLSASFGLVISTLYLPNQIIVYYSLATNPKLKKTRVGHLNTQSVVTNYNPLLIGDSFTSNKVSLPVFSKHDDHKINNFLHKQDKRLADPCFALIKADLA